MYACTRTPSSRPSLPPLPPAPPFHPSLLLLPPPPAPPQDADKHIMKQLKEKGRLVHQSQIKHSYPFCWRSETPLIYRAVPSWFIRVESIVEKLLANNKKCYWWGRGGEEMGGSGRGEEMGGGGGGEEMGGGGGGGEERGGGGGGEEMGGGGGGEEM